MFEWVQQLRVQACQASQILGVYLVGFALVGVDEPQFAGIGHQDLVATLLSSTLLTHGEWVPASMAMRRGSSEAKRRLKASGVVRSLPSSITSPLSLVDEAQVGVLVAEIQPGCHLWLHFATIHCGPILLSGPLEPVEHLQTLRVLRMGGRPSHLIFGELRQREVRRIPLPRTPVNRIRGCVRTGSTYRF